MASSWGTSWGTSWGGSWGALEAPDAPADPSDLSAVAVSHNRVHLTWVDNSDNETGFQVERAPDAGGSSGTYALIGTVGANVTQYDAVGLTPETTYWFRVRAVNGSEASGYATEDSATTQAASAATGDAGVGLLTIRKRRR